MLKEDCFFLGHITKVHGLQGEVLAALDTDVPERYTHIDSLYIDQNGELIPYFISQISISRRGHFILAFEGVNYEQAQLLVKESLYLPLSMLPPLKGNQFYYHEIIGFAVYDAVHGLIGHCLAVNDQGAQPLFVIQGLAQEEILVPVHDHFIQKVDRAKQRLDLHLPEGLLELYRPS